MPHLNMTKSIPNALNNSQYLDHRALNDIKKHQMAQKKHGSLEMRDARQEIYQNI